MTVNKVFSFHKDSWALYIVLYNVHKIEKFGVYSQRYSVLKTLQMMHNEFSPPPNGDEIDWNLKPAVAMALF